MRSSMDGGFRADSAPSHHGPYVHLALGARLRCNAHGNTVGVSGHDLIWRMFPSRSHTRRLRPAGMDYFAQSQSNSGPSFCPQCGALLQLPETNSIACDACGYRCRYQGPWPPLEPPTTLLPKHPGMYTLNARELARCLAMAGCRPRQARGRDTELGEAYAAVASGRPRCAGGPGASSRHGGGGVPQVRAQGPLFLHHAAAVCG